MPIQYFSVGGIHIRNTRFYLTRKTWTRKKCKDKTDLFTFVAKNQSVLDDGCFVKISQLHFLSQWGVNCYCRDTFQRVTLNTVTVSITWRLNKGRETFANFFYFAKVKKHWDDWSGGITNTQTSASHTEGKRKKGVDSGGRWTDGGPPCTHIFARYAQYWAIAWAPFVCGMSL